MRKYVNITAITLVTLLLVAWYLNLISIFFLIPIIILYLMILVVGSSRIGMKYFINSYCKGDTNKKEIVLSFDDGPDPGLTPEVLRILDKSNVKATFFCIGDKVKSNPKLIEQMFKSGHILGNHTYFHSRLFDLFSSHRMVNEINFTNNEIYKITGQTPRLFRPPYGITNPLLKKALRKTQMISIGWSIRSFDTVRSEDKIFQKLVSKTTKGDIVLFHDTISGVASLLSRYLKWLEENNFTIVSLPQLLNIPAYES